MVIGVVAIVIVALWILAFVVQQRVVVSKVWIGFDVVVGVVIVIALAVDGRLSEGIAIALIIVPILIMFSALRAIQMRYIDRKTKAIMDGASDINRAGLDERDDSL